MRRHLRKDREKSFLGLGRPNMKADSLQVRVAHQVPKGGDWAFEPGSKGMLGFGTIRSKIFSVSNGVI